MSYNPYANIADADATQTNRVQQPQPQRATSFGSQVPHPQQLHQHQQPIGVGAGGAGGTVPFGSQQFVPGQQIPGQNPNQFFTPAANQGDNPAFGNFINDPRAQMTYQIGQGAFQASSQFMEQNFGKYVHTDDIKYYFKVSNSYVLSKLLLILYPFQNKSWLRSYRRSDDSNNQVDAGTELYAYPLEDKNAVDLYIPLMGTVTYILLLALLAGLKGEFHPEVFGFKTSSTLAYLLLDLTVLKLGLYLLGVNSKIWDLVSYIGYKFVPLVLLVLIKNISTSRFINIGFYLYLLAAYGFFEIRAIRFNLYGGVHNSAQTMNSKSAKNSNYFLLAYALFQGLLLWLLS
ncbi:putative membrane protein [Wickerhamomyces ciferrii]|uniref:Protein YIF1 n=1 Tax=Wickerhamomyces ciferrii (strain ATCC 14091 / BCRC 22168 / CBS 111 / JCM 3599 / NBRC 0793 / NRRL Y-1031 F-60-10) TaxID=1206466 RepID=K0KM88_WICCF|nr:uncharacterized protein BN7_3664 [Wickerhamomyces ciferrii]CCH44106.1 putative membrane protein [Wickerhamomyces ciferrii]